ncbi:membrane protein [Microbacterium phage Milani]|nr:membrane protein [Microbacterium phage Milani]
MTKPIPVITRWERFKRLTVWHPINTDPNDDYRHGPRFWYPGYDLMAVTLGVYALMLGSPLLNRLFPTWFTNGMGLVLIVAGGMAFLGVVFPKLYLVELAGKLLIVFLMSGYSGTIAWLSQNAGENGFVVIALAMIPVLLAPRITYLFIRTSRSRPFTTAKAWVRARLRK